MQAGTPVTLIGLVGRADLNGQKGRTVALVPSTGRYGVALDNGEQISVKLQNLSAKYDETRHGDMLTIHGLNYCADHRLECCGSCFTSYNVQNRMAELGFMVGSRSKAESDRIMKQAYDLCDAEAEKNQPPRRAPMRPGSVQSKPGKVEKEQRVSAGMDLSRRPKWNDEKIMPFFLECISMEEKLNGTSAPGANLSYEVRETLAIIAERCDVPGDRERTLFVIQDEAQSQSLAMSVIDVVQGDTNNMEGHTASVD